MKPWKWFGDLSDDDKTAARAVLADHPKLRGMKLAWDGECLFGYMRPPTQLWYFYEDDGSVGPWLQKMFDTREFVDTKDGGLLCLVPLTPRPEAPRAD